MSLFGIIRYEEGREKTSKKSRTDLLENLKRNAKNRASVKTAEKRSANGNLTTSSPQKVAKVESKKKKVKPAVSLEQLPPQEATKIDALKETENGATEAMEHAVLKESNEERVATVTENYDPLKAFKRGMKRQQMTVIGSDLKDHEEDVQQKLPEWLEHPRHISNDVNNVSNNFSLNCLHQLLRTNLEKMGITRLFPVQSSLIPVILFDTKYGLEGSYTRPSDLCVCAPTGSGKTLAFAVPIVQSLLHCPTHNTRALVVLPTVELAKQVHGVFLELCRGSKINVIVLGGSNSLFEETQVLYRVTKYGVKVPPDIIVSTPGRLVHHLEQNNSLDLSKLRFLVIDEADRIMDFIKQSWLQKLEKLFPSSRFGSDSCMTLDDLYTCVTPVQKLLFSATLSTDPEKLKDLQLFQPRLFTSSLLPSDSTADVQRTKYFTPPGLKEYRITCTAGEKPLVVMNLINTLSIKKALCFTSTAESAHRLSLVLEQYSKVRGDHEQSQFKSMEFSSQLTKKERRRKLSQFKSGRINILVSSDSTARGIDVEDVEQVILYDAPRFIETYIHRVGRTSRAGKPGTSYTLVRPEEMFYFKKMFRDAGKELPKNQRMTERELGNLQADYEAALERVGELIEEEKTKETSRK